MMEAICRAFAVGRTHCNRQCRRPQIEPICDQTCADRMPIRPASKTARDPERSGGPNGFHGQTCGKRCHG